MNDVSRRLEVQKEELSRLLKDLSELGRTRLVIPLMIDAFSEAISDTLVCGRWDPTGVPPWIDEVTKELEVACREKFMQKLHRKVRGR